MNFRTDLASEAHEISRGEATEIEGVISETQKLDELEITTVEVINEQGANAIGKSVGKYITISVPELKYSAESYQKAVAALAAQIKLLSGAHKNTLTLVVGLGNNDITPDRIGNMAVSQIMVTHHMKKHAPEIFTDEISPVCAIAPGVLGTTGMETSDIIKSIADDLKPDLIIVVDALAAADYSRIGTTVQVSDAGIQPGAGVGNNRNALNKESLGIPVIAVGVPTVVDASAITDGENTQPLMVTPRDIDLIVKKCAKAIAGGINLALQDSMSLSEIEEYVG